VLIDDTNDLGISSIAVAKQDGLKRGKLTSRIRGVRFGISRLSSADERVSRRVRTGQWYTEASRSVYGTQERSQRSKKALEAKIDEFHKKLKADAREGGVSDWANFSVIGNLTETRDCHLDPLETEVYLFGDFSGQDNNRELHVSISDLIQDSPAEVEKVLRGARAWLSSGDGPRKIGRVTDGGRGRK
jgi:hypothetical protein